MPTVSELAFDVMCVVLLLVETSWTTTLAVVGVALWCGYAGVCK